MAAINLQNLIKDPLFLRTLKAAPGHKLVYSDINSLEPHVMAHFTQDPGLMALYGPGAKLNCVYLFVAAQTEKWGPIIRQHYDPFNPTPESITAAKTHCSKERTQVKPVYLGWLYGLGAGTMHIQTGIPVEECKVILGDINAAFSGVPQFNQALKREWESNGGSVVVDWEYSPELEKKVPIVRSGSPGWIYNGRMRPLAVAPDKTKDLGNRFVQSTGHDVLLQLLCIIDQARKVNRVSMRPYNVDVHDATIWEVREDQAEQAKALIENSYVELNKMLNWSVKIAGEVEVGDSLADFYHE